MAVKFHVLYLGRIDCQRFRLVGCKDESAMISSPMTATLIQHPTLGNILVDTGNSPFYTTEYGDHINEIYPVAEFISIEDALKNDGLTVYDIDMLILTHLHFDHVGGLRYFAGTKAIKNVYVSEAELQSAWSTVLCGDGGAYVRKLFDVEGIQFHTYSKEKDFGEGLTLFEQHSHTAGCTGYILETGNNGNWIFSSDTIYTMDSYTNRTPPGGNINKSTEEFYRICDQLTDMLHQYDAKLMPGHDYNMVREFNEKGFID